MIKLIDSSAVFDRPMVQIYGVQRLQNSNGGVIFGSHFTLYRDQTMSIVLATVLTGEAKAYRLPSLTQLCVRCHRPVFINADALSESDVGTTPPVFLNRNLTSQFVVGLGAVETDVYNGAQIPEVSRVLWDVRLKDNSVSGNARTQAYYHPFVPFGFGTSSGGMIPLLDSSVTPSVVKQLQSLDSTVSGLPNRPELANYSPRSSLSATNISRGSGVLLPIAVISLAGYPVWYPYLNIEINLQTTISTTLPNNGGYGPLSVYIILSNSAGASSPTLDVPWSMLSFANATDRVWSFDISEVSSVARIFLTAAASTASVSNTLQQLDQVFIRLMIPESLQRAIYDEWIEIGPGNPRLHVMVAPSAIKRAVDGPVTVTNLSVCPAEPYFSRLSTVGVGVAN